MSRLYLALAAGVAALVVVLGFYFWGRAAGDAARLRKVEPVIAGLRGDVARCNATVAQQSAAIDAQNAALSELERQGVERERAAREAISRAQAEARKALQRAERITKAQPGPDQCKSARTLIVDTLAEERR